MVLVYKSVDWASTNVNVLVKSFLLLPSSLLFPYCRARRASHGYSWAKQPQPSFIPPKGLASAASKFS
jgi:hypothetical protein